MCVWVCAGYAKEAAPFLDRSLSGGCLQEVGPWPRDSCCHANGLATWPLRHTLRSHAVAHLHCKKNAVEHLIDIAPNSIQGLFVVVYTQW